MLTSVLLLSYDFSSGVHFRNVVFSLNVECGCLFAFMFMTFVTVVLVIFTCRNVLSTTFGTLMTLALMSVVVVNVDVVYLCD